MRAIVPKQTALVNLLAFERQQRHESSAFDSIGHSILADRGAARFTTTDNLAVAIDQFF